MIKARETNGFEIGIKYLVLNGTAGDGWSCV
jgi:hypothetical protein